MLVGQRYATYFAGVAGDAVASIVEAFGSRFLNLTRHKIELGHCDARQARATQLIQTDLVSMNASMPSGPPSRPNPDSAYPPNGRAGATGLCAFTHIVPARSRLASLRTCARSFDQMLAARP